MAAVIVDIADMAASKDPACELVTYSLGSCIGLAIWDPVTKVGGMLHYMLPEAALSPEKAKSNPAMFCDTGVPRLFRAVYELGGTKNRLIVKVAGGSQLLDNADIFNIGKRNYIALRKIFWKNGVMIDSEDVGGSISRTLRLNVGTGKLTIKTRSGEAVL
ncbi:MAG: chemotaxis protein CheD [Planctomycetota bacterium]